MSILDIYSIENQRCDLLFDLVQDSLGFSPLFKPYFFCLRLLSLSLSIVGFSLVFFNPSILDSDGRNCWENSGNGGAPRDGGEDDDGDDDGADDGADDGGGADDDGADDGGGAYWK